MSENIRSYAREAAFTVCLPLEFPVFGSWTKEKHNAEWKKIWQSKDTKI